jgi:mRNA-degrading endonuclease toxin of MazEF toxin-antitoxin module
MGYPSWPLQRGQVYLIHFQWTLDPRLREGKDKLCVILQGGRYFERYNTVLVALCTSKLKGLKGLHGPTNVIVEAGDLFPERTIIDCAQLYSIRKEWVAKGTRVGDLSEEILTSIDKAIAIATGIYLLE